MDESFQTILSIQELDINIIRLMRVKKERQKELSKIHQLKSDIQKQVSDKEAEILDVKKEIRMGENQVKEIQEKIAKLESQQAAVKKMDEFNALTHEMTAAGRERSAIEHRLSDLMDKLAAEEDLLVTLKENLQSTEENSNIIEKEIRESIDKINEEGRSILEKREGMKGTVSPELFEIYERLLKNKRDRVVVPIEKRTCSGCHILLTPQHENLVRKGDRLIFCEHCSRILYWQEAEISEGEEDAAPRRRRRRATTAAT
ncbi:MAG: zinc ribbon domain-containing protein [Chlamydiales bacterium]|nr:zinc ribbon domain-containing protein [Chlamydiales bacterium]